MTERGARGLHEKGLSYNLWKSILAKPARPWSEVMNVWLSRPLNWLNVLGFLLGFFIVVLITGLMQRGDSFANARSKRPDGAIEKPSDLRKASAAPDAVLGIDLSSALHNGPSFNDRPGFGWSTNDIASMKSLQWMRIDRKQLGMFTPEWLAKFPSLTVLHVTGTRLELNDMERISHFRKLQHLELEVDHFPENLAPLSVLSLLESLVVRETDSTHGVERDTRPSLTVFTQLRELASLREIALIPRAFPGQWCIKNATMTPVAFRPQIIRELKMYPALKWLWVGERLGRARSSLVEKLDEDTPGVTVAPAEFNVGTIYEVALLCLLLVAAVLLLRSNFQIQMSLPQARLVPGYLRSHLLVAFVNLFLVANLVAVGLSLSSDVRLSAAISVTSSVVLIALAAGVPLAMWDFAGLGSVKALSLTNLLPTVFVCVVFLVIRNGVLPSHQLLHAYGFLCASQWVIALGVVLVSWPLIVACLSVYRKETVRVNEGGLVSTIFASPFSSSDSTDPKLRETPLQQMSVNDFNARFKGASRDNWMGRVRLVWISECVPTPMSLMKSVPWALVGFLPCVLILWDGEFWIEPPLLVLILCFGLGSVGLATLVGGNDQLKNEIILPRTKSELFGEKLLAGGISFLSTVGMACVGVIAYQWFASETFGASSLLLKLTGVLGGVLMLCALKMWFSTVNIWGAIPLVLAGIVGVSVFGTILAMEPNGNMSIKGGGLTEITGSWWAAISLVLVSVWMIYGAKGRWMTTEFTQL